MNSRLSAPGNDTLNTSGITDAFRNILRFGGGWGNISGPGIFMTRVIVSGTLASIFMGMSGASIGALIFDTATIPFVISASAGFVMGAWGFYRDAVRKSLRAVDRFPQLLRLHLDLNFPHRGFDAWEIGMFRSDAFDGSWIMQSMLIASWMTANRAIERIYEAEEERILLPLTGGSEEVEAQVEED